MSPLQPLSYPKWKQGKEGGCTILPTSWFMDLADTAYEDRSQQKHIAEVMQATSLSAKAYPVLPEPVGEGWAARCDLVSFLPKTATSHFSSWQQEDGHPTDIHALIPKTCDDATSRGKRHCDFDDSSESWVGGSILDYAGKREGKGVTQRWKLLMLVVKMKAVKMSFFRSWGR